MYICMYCTEYYSLKKKEASRERLSAAGPAGDAAIIALVISEEFQHSHKAGLNPSKVRSKPCEMH